MKNNQRKETMITGRMTGFLSITSLLSGSLILALSIAKYGDSALVAGAAALAGAFVLFAIASILSCLGEITRKLGEISQKIESLESDAKKSEAGDDV